VPAPGTILNFLMYQAGWFAAVLGAGYGRPWSGAAAALGLVAAHVALARRRTDEAALVMAAGAVGLVLDTLHAAAGIVVYRPGVHPSWLCPPWIVALWMQLATMLRFCLRWLRGRYALASLLGAAGGPLAFRAGEALGAARIGEPRLRSFLALALSWAVATPLLLRWADRRAGVEGAGLYRFPRKG
jgi:hypothetical protein